MSILRKASADLRRRLLDLYPVAKLRKESGQKGSKEGISQAMAASHDPHKLDEIAEFLDTNLPSCKQHIHVFSHSGDAALPVSIPEGELVKADNDHALYLARVRFDVVVLDSLAKRSIEFLWPVRIDLHQKYMLVRFVVMEKNIGSYFDEPVFVRSKSLSEEAITAGLLADGSVGYADLNKGFKSLWAEDRIDATRIRYKESDATVTRAMDEEKGLKQTNPQKYAELQRFPLYQTVFIPYRAFTEIGAFTADPTRGFIGFTRYFKEGASGDGLIRQILKHN